MSVLEQAPPETPPIEVGTPESASLLTAFDRIAEMARLPADWDREGAEAPTASAVAATCVLIEAVAADQERRGGRRLAPTTSSPIPDGGLQVEWEGPSARIDVQANRDGSYGFLVDWGAAAARRYQEADDVPRETLVGLISRVLAA